MPLDRSPGVYDTQWYWVLFGEEDYFNCANVVIESGACTNPAKVRKLSSFSPLIACESRVRGGKCS